MPGVIARHDWVNESHQPPPPAQSQPPSPPLEQPQGNQPPPAPEQPHGQSQPPPPEQASAQPEPPKEPPEQPPPAPTPASTAPSEPAPTASPSPPPAPPGSTPLFPIIAPTPATNYPTTTLTPWETVPVATNIGLLMPNPSKDIYAGVVYKFGFVEAGSRPAPIAGGWMREITPYLMMPNNTFNVFPGSGTLDPRNDTATPIDGDPLCGALTVFNWAYTYPFEFANEGEYVFAINETWLKPTIEFGRCLLPAVDLMSFFASQTFTVAAYPTGLPPATPTEPYTVWANIATSAPPTPVPPAIPKAGMSHADKIAAGLTVTFGMLGLFACFAIWYWCRKRVQAQGDATAFRRLRPAEQQEFLSANPDTPFNPLRGKNKNYWKLLCLPEPPGSKPTPIPRNKVPRMRGIQSQYAYPHAPSVMSHKQHQKYEAVPQNTYQYDENGRQEYLGEYPGSIGHSLDSVDERYERYPGSVGQGAHSVGGTSFATAPSAAEAVVGMNKRGFYDYPLSHAAPPSTSGLSDAGATVGVGARNPYDRSPRFPAFTPVTPGVSVAGIRPRIPSNKAYREQWEDVDWDTSAPPNRGPPVPPKDSGLFPKYQSGR